MPSDSISEGCPTFFHLVTFEILSQVSGHSTKMTAAGGRVKLTEEGQVQVIRGLI